jgi:phospholipid/cholesterol/gamma-HCH transport system substrate-binding protein
MDPKLLQFRVGVMVLASVALLVVLILLFSDISQIWQPTYEINVRLSDATGVQRGTPVRKSGILIGRVSQVQLAERGAMVTLRIDRNVTIGRNEVCLLRNSLFGDAELIFVREDSVPVTAGESSV